MASWPKYFKPDYIWDWDLPKLTELSLSFEYAHNLDFEMFQGTPNLTILQLTGGANESSLGPLIDPSIYNCDVSVLAQYIRAFGLHISQEQIDSLDNRPPCLPKLQDLEINGAWHMNQVMLRYLFTRMAPNIETLLIHGPIGFSAEELVDTTSQNLRSLTQVDSDLYINAREAKSAGIKYIESPSSLSQFFLINPPKGYNPTYIFSGYY
jgi:hypothetical protein